MKDFYLILGLDADASLESIKLAYRRLALEFHPDRVLHLGKEEQAQSSSRMADLNEAYSVLSDTRQRREYDSKYVAVPSEEGAPSMAEAMEEALKAAGPAVTRPRARPAQRPRTGVAGRAGTGRHRAAAGAARGQPRPPGLR